MMGLIIGLNRFDCQNRTIYEISSYIMNDYLTRISFNRD